MLGLIAYQVKAVKDNVSVKDNVKSTLITDNPAGVPCAYVSSSVYLRCSSVYLRCSSVSSSTSLSVLSGCA